MLLLSLYRGLAYVLLASVFCFTATADTTTDALAQIPACGLQCIAQSLPSIGCGLLDTECQCTSKNATKILQPCLESLCSYDETFVILRAQATICNRPHDTLTSYIRVTAYVTGIIPIAVIIMRFTSRLLGGNKLWWDDWIHLASMVLVIPMTVCLLFNVEAGLGHHVWDLTYPDVVAIQEWTYIATIIWGFELLLIKYSILCLYLRIFPNVWLKRAIYFFMVFTAAFTLPLLGLAAFQCLPVSAIWDLAQRPHAKCVDWITVLRLTVVYEVIAEIVLFALPIPIVLKLQMEASKKVQLIAFFSLGICVIVVSAIRIPFLPGVVDTTDPTYTVIPTSITAFVASAVGHITAAVPTVKALFRFCANGFKLDSKASSSYAKKSTNGTSSKRSYRSLQDSRDNSSSSVRSIGTAGKGPTRDPYSLASIVDVEDTQDEFMELHQVQTQAIEGTKANAELGGLGGLGRQQLSVVRECSDQEEIDDSSNKSILQKDSYP